MTRYCTGAAQRHIPVATLTTSYVPGTMRLEAGSDLDRATMRWSTAAVFESLGLVKRFY